MVSVTSLPTCPETNGLGGPSEARDRQLLSHRCLEVDVLLGSRRFVRKSTFCLEVDVLFGSRRFVRKSTFCLEVDVSGLEVAVSGLGVAVSGLGVAVSGLGVAISGLEVDGFRVGRRRSENGPK